MEWIAYGNLMVCGVILEVLAALYTSIFRFIVSLPKLDTEFNKFLSKKEKEQKKEIYK